MRASSKATLDAASSTWEPILSSAGPEAFTYGRQLFDVVDVLDSSASLRRALTDPSRTGGDKAKVIEAIFGAKVAEPVGDLLAGLARGRWSDEADVADAVAHLATDSVLASAQNDGVLETVEEEVFRVGRVLAQNRELRLALSDSSATLSRRRDLVRSVFDGKVTTQSAYLLERSVGSARHPSLAAALTEVSELAAGRRRRLVAVVTAAVPLTQAQQDRLGEILARNYGRQVQINIAMDPQVLGGLRIQIGEDVLDATTVARLSEARRRLAG